MRDGAIKDLRQLELELICAGKVILCTIQFCVMITNGKQLASQSDTAYERFVSHVTCLSDTLYSEGESDKSRTEYQIEDIDVTMSLIPDENSSDDDGTDGFDIGELMDDHNAAMGFGAADASVETFGMEADAILDDS